MEEDGTITELALEEAAEQPSAPTPKLTQENQAEPAPKLPIPLEPEVETRSNGLVDIVYVPSFGGIENCGTN